MQEGILPHTTTESVEAMADQVFSGTVSHSQAQILIIDNQVKESLCQKWFWAQFHKQVLNVDLARVYLFSVVSLRTDYFSLDFIAELRRRTS